MTDNDFAHLTDFGVAPALSGGTTLTVTVTTVGTRACMAPERFLGQPADRKPPVCRGEAAGADVRPRHQSPPRASVQYCGVPAALDEVIARGLAKDPSQRFTTASELASAANTALRSPVGAAVTADRPVGVSTVAWVPSVPETASDPPSGGRSQEQLFELPPPPSPARPRNRDWFSPSQLPFWSCSPPSC